MAEKILASRAALEGERKQVTVLFADIKGSTELIRALDTEEAQALLDGAVKVMMEAVHRYEGTVSRLMGDGLMALFGAPIAHEDHAVRACYAALALQDGMRRYAEEVRRAQGALVEARVGLNSGEVIIRLVSDDLHLDYTAMGQTVHLAARLEQLAAAGTTLLTAATLGLVEGYVQVRALGPVAIKGLDEPIALFELVGAGMARTRLQAAVGRGLTRFVGRQAEQAILHNALEHARDGHGQVVALVGEPGVGKSRLVWELIHSHRVQDWLVLEGGSVSHGKATSYLPVIDLLKAYSRIEPRDDARAIREKVAGKVLMLDRALEPSLAAVLALLDVPVEDPAWQALDPAQRRRQTLDAVRRLLLRECREQPLLLVFEDLHWIDEQTQALIDGLVESLPTARILLLVNYRPEYRHEWGRETYYTQLRIDPLPPEGAEDLLRALLGADPALEPLERHLIERTEGNPFFLEESVRALIESGVLTGQRGAYSLARDLSGIRVPATVQAILAARIDRLAPDDKRLLQTAAVIGKDVPLALLRAIADLPDGELHDGLARLQGAEFLYEAALFPELEYTFTHALTHEVAYGSLLQDRRRTLHAGVVEAIEALCAARLDEHVERLAHHAFRGEDWGKTLAYARQAGAKAAARSANREAVAYFEQALVALPHLPESRDKLEQAIDLRVDLRSVLFPLGDQGRIFVHLREAESLAQVLGDQRRLGWVSCFMGSYFWTTGDHGRAVESSQRALAIAATRGDFGLQVVAQHVLGLAHHSLGDYRRAMDFLGRNVASLAGDLVRERFGLPGPPFVFSRAWLVLCLAERGEFAEGLARGREGVRVAEEVNQPYTLVTAANGLGFLYLRRGDLDQAIAVLERHLRLGRVAHVPVLLPLVTALLGYAYALCGRSAEGLALLEEAVDRAASMNIIYFQPLWMAWLSEAHLLAGRSDDAVKLAERARELSHDRGERGHQAWTLRLLGEIASHQELADVAQGKAWYRRALALAEELAMLPLQAHCHLGLGTLYRKIGRMDEARAELSTALEMLRSMEMTHWIPKAEAELAEAIASPAANQVG